MKTKKLLSIALIFVMLVSMFAFLPNYVQAESSLRSRLTGVYLKDDSVTQGDTAGVNFMMVGDLSKVEATLQFYSVNAKQSLSAKVEGLGTSNAYFSVPRDTGIGDYELMYINIKENNQTVTFATNTIQGSSMPVTNCLGQKYLAVLEYEGAEEDTFEDSLRNISFKQSKANLEDKVYLNFLTQVNKSYMSLSFYNETINGGPIIYVSDVNSEKPYFIVDGTDDRKGASEAFKEGLTYKLRTVFVDNETYNLSALGIKEPTLTINKNTNNDNNVTTDKHQDLKGINFIADDGINKSVTANLNDSVNVELDWGGAAIQSAMFSLKNKSTSEVLTVYLKELAKQPYFIVPYTAKAGTYELDYVLITDEDGNKSHYRSGEASGNIQHLDFGCSLTINDAIGKNEEGIYEFDNDIVDEFIDKIAALEENVVLTIDANKQPIISETLFKTMQSKDQTLIIDYMGNQWIFYGKDIVNPKEIDVSVLITELSATTAKPLTSMMSHGVVLDFAANGYLPGKSLIRIKADEVNMEGLEEGKKYYAYYFDELNEKLDRVAMDKILADGYYEFYINHNSTYVITNEQVDSKYVSDKTEDLALNQEIANTSTTTTGEKVKETNNTKMDENLKLKIIIIVLCVIILIIVLCGKKFFVGIKKDSK